VSLLNSYLDIPGLPPSPFTPGTPGVPGGPGTPTSPFRPAVPRPGAPFWPGVPGAPGPPRSPSTPGKPPAPYNYRHPTLLIMLVTFTGTACYHHRHLICSEQHQIHVQCTIQCRTGHQNMKQLQATETKPNKTQKII